MSSDLTRQKLANDLKTEALKIIASYQDRLGLDDAMWASLQVPQMVATMILKYPEAAALPQEGTEK